MTILIALIAFSSPRAPFVLEVPVLSHRVSFNKYNYSPGNRFLTTYLRTALLPAVLVGGILVVVARAPILQSRGTFRFRAEGEPKTVADTFTGPTSPVLAFQWGVASR